MVYTILGKSKEQIIYELVLSLNSGNSYYSYDTSSNNDRVWLAKYQYDRMVEEGIIVENVSEREN